MISTLEQLNQFSKKPTGTGWATDSHKITLLADYIWCRTLTPGLTLETFLKRFEPVADYGPENQKFPLDAINSLKARKVTVAQRLELLALYVDTLDLAAEQGEELNILLIDFLNSVVDHYLANNARPAKAEETQTVSAPAEVPKPAYDEADELDAGFGQAGNIANSMSARIRKLISAIPADQLATARPKLITDQLAAQGVEITPTIRVTTSKLLSAAKQNSGQPVQNSGQPELQVDLVQPAAPPPEAPAPKKTKRKPKLKEFTSAALDTAPYKAGVRIVWTPPPELCAPPARGVIKATDGDTACDILLDDGSRLFNVPMKDLHIRDIESDPLPDVPFDYDRNPIQDIRKLTYPMTAQTLEEVHAKLNPVYADQLAGTFKVEAAGQVLMDISLRVEATPYYVQLQLVTAVPQPVIVAKLTNVEQNKIVHALPPRRTIVGTYTFVDQAAGIAVMLEVPKD